MQQRKNPTSFMGGSVNYNHLILDASGCKNLTNESVITEFLLDLVKIAKMKLLTRKGVINPQIFLGSKKLPGLTSTVIIETSHISIHTFSDTGKVNFDIYSCKSFDNYKVVQHFRKVFKPKHLEIVGVHRKN